MSAPIFTVFQSDDGRWRIRFRKDLIRAVGRGSDLLSFSEKETAERIAGIVARDAQLSKLHHAQADRPVAIADETLPLFEG
ncbi:hypothetical protein A2G06_16910 (plasmid) [Geobacter anodireducens]|nr:hypothetical protein A2G06_16910 [Geobacter anodireducens]